MKVYLDNAATTRPFESVVNIMNVVNNEDYGNPSSMHIKGYEAEKYIKASKDVISKVLKVDSKEIYFTSGGTESNNLALIGASLANNRQGKHIISTRFEHPSVYNPLLFLEEMGYEVEFIEVDNMGHISLDDLASKIRKDTILVSTMHVNNEVGAIQDIEAIAKVIKSVNNKTLYHVDAIQSFGKFKIFPKRWDVDMLSISGHKIHGPKGCGVLFVKDKTKIRPIIHGGGQEKGLRSGTENVAGIAGIGQATKEMYDNLSDNVEKMYQLKIRLIEGLCKLEKVTINAVDMNDLNESIYKTAPHIVSASFDGIRSEVLLHTLEEKGIYVSSGSACSSNHPAISGTLKAIGVQNNLLDSTIRFSFSSTSTVEDVDYTIKKIEEVLDTLRKYVRH